MVVPKAINPVRCKIPFSCASINHIEVPETYASLRLQIVPEGFVADTTLKLSFFNTEWVFTFKAVPDDTGYQLTAKGAETFAVWWVAFLLELKLNRFIYPYFNVTETTSDTLRIRSKEYGSNYNITLSEANAAILSDVDAAGVDEVLKTNFGFNAQLIQLDYGTDETILGEDWLAGNDVEFDMHKFLIGALKSTLYFPQIEAEWKKSNYYAMKTFFFRYWEKAANHLGEIKSSVNYKAIGGGLTALHEKLIEEDATDYLALMKSGDILIQTNRPLLSTIHYQQPVLFYFINHFGAEITFTATVTLKYTDDTTHNAVLSGGNSLLLQADYQGCFLISPALHGLADINPAKTIDTIEFSIGTNTAKSSETFVLQLKESLFSKGLIFRNSFDTWESATFFGLSETKDKYTRLFFEALSTKIQTKVSETESFILNSGWLSKEERNALRDLTTSSEIYLVYGKNLFRANILSTENIRELDKVYRYSLQIELELTGDNEFFSAREVDSLAPGIVITDDNFIVTDIHNVIGY